MDRPTITEQSENVEIKCFALNLVILSSVTSVLSIESKKCDPLSSSSVCYHPLICFEKKREIVFFVISQQKKI